MYEINPQSSVPTYEQIINLILSQIINGLLDEGDKLPSIRQFAQESGINPNTVTKAYRSLEAENIIQSISGKGTFVSKINQPKITDMVLRDFDSSVKHALKSGIKKSELVKRIENMEETNDKA